MILNHIGASRLDCSISKQRTCRAYQQDGSSGRDGKSAGEPEQDQWNIAQIPRKLGAHSDMTSTGGQSLWAYPRLAGASGNW